MVCAHAASCTDRHYSYSLQALRAELEVKGYSEMVLRAKHLAIRQVNVELDAAVTKAVQDTLAASLQEEYGAMASKLLANQREIESLRQQVHQFPLMCIITLHRKGYKWYAMLRYALLSYMYAMLCYVYVMLSYNT